MYAIDHEHTAEVMNEIMLREDMYGTRSTEYEPQTDLAEKASALISEAYERYDVSFDTSFVSLVVTDSIKTNITDLLSQPAGRHVGIRKGDCWTHSIIFLSEDYYEKMGWDQYSHVIMHELAHLETAARYFEENGTVEGCPADGDAVFEEVCVEFHAYRNPNDIESDAEHLSSRWW